MKSCISKASIYEKEKGEASTLQSNSTLTEHPTCTWRDRCCEGLKHELGTFLVPVVLGIPLPMQGTPVQSLVQEDPTPLGATKLCATATEAHTPEPVVRNKSSHHREKPRHSN